MGLFNKNYKSFGPRADGTFWVMVTDDDGGVLDVLFEGLGRKQAEEVAAELQKAYDQGHTDEYAYIGSYGGLASNGAIRRR